MRELEEVADSWGPEKIVYVHDAAVGLKAVLVVDNTALGPGKGGIRLVPDLTANEVFRLARAMTWKNALAGLPWGGGKSGIKSNATTPTQKQALVRSFARALKPLIPNCYIAGPDMGTSEAEMAAIADEIGKKTVTGRPESMGGLPHELGSTGYGVAESTDVALAHAGLGVAGASIAIEGFGNVGTFAARFLVEKGARVVAVSDSQGATYNKSGLDIDKLIEWKQIEKKTVPTFFGGTPIPAKDIFSLEVDVLIPGARPDVINAGNIGQIKAKIISQAANLPVSEEINGKSGEKILADMGILVVPDLVANAGGVISSYVEYGGGNESRMFALVKEKVRANTQLVLDTSKKEGILPREAAMRIARKRVRDAMDRREADRKAQQKLAA